MQFSVRFNQTNQKFPVKFGSDCKAFSAAFQGLQTVHTTPDRYEGVYEVTPQRTEQVLSTKNLMMESDVVVKAIPKEYGLVTYDQSKSITVS